MKSKTKKEVIARLQEGAEPQEIVREFINDAAPATIYKWIREYDEENGLGELDEGTDIQIEGLGESDEELELDKEDLEIQDDKKLILEKRKTLKRFRYLMKEINAQSDEHEWGRKELKAMYLQLDKCQSSVESLCDCEEDSYSELAIWKHLETFGELFQDLAAAGKSISLSFDESYEYNLEKALEVNDFDEVFEIEEYLEDSHERLFETLSEYDGSKITEETAYELKDKVDVLIAEIKSNEIEDQDVLQSLVSISRDLKHVANQAANSFWEKALFELDEDLKLTGES